MSSPPPIVTHAERFAQKKRELRDRTPRPGFPLRGADGLTFAERKELEKQKANG